ncbi:hypothetical protein M0R45_021092 [Rubus argutus]|uniref:Trichome birefringence-like C-terminal domain-containing protein n=1 Tax=Rubus argutus TaxID=59490 RepID=A0AAW1XAC2_RUBAR
MGAGFTTIHILCVTLLAAPAYSAPLIAHQGWSSPQTRLHLFPRPEAVEWNRRSDLRQFDTWHWWLHVGRKQPWDLLQVGNQTYKDMDRLVAYEKALNTWATGVDSNVDPAKTKVFFQGVSPDHQNASDWTLNPKSEAMNCTAESKPLHGGGSDYPRAHPAEQVVEKPRKCYITCQSQPGRLLNVTSLSQLRKDGHPSVYGLALTETHG